mmetsp:Transcript_50013/g.79133  ORF Transcript_50013/g.79133 Transcript_50013/m.79133 type:complete len:572 (-) Transcript_50013:121-1836(-)
MGLLQLWQETFPTRKKKLSRREVAFNGKASRLVEVKGQKEEVKGQKAEDQEAELQRKLDIKRIVRDFCQRTSLTRVEPTEKELEDLWSRLISSRGVTSNDALAAAEMSHDLSTVLSELISGDSHSHEWKPRLRTLCVLEFFFCRGDAERSIASIVVKARINSLHFLAKEVPALSDKVWSVLQLSHFAKVLPDGENLRIEKIDGVLIPASQRNVEVQFEERDSESSNASKVVEREKSASSSEPALNSAQSRKKKVSFQEAEVVIEHSDSEAGDIEVETCESEEVRPDATTDVASDLLSCPTSEAIADLNHNEASEERPPDIAMAEVNDLVSCPMSGAIATSEHDEKSEKIPPDVATSDAKDLLSCPMSEAVADPKHDEEKPSDVLAEANHLPSSEERSPDIVTAEVDDDLLSFPDVATAEVNDLLICALSEANAKPRDEESEERPPDVATAEAISGAIANPEHVEGVEACPLSDNEEHALEPARSSVPQRMPSPMDLIEDSCDENSVLSRPIGSAESNSSCDQAIEREHQQETKRQVPYIPWGIELTIPEPKKDSLTIWAEESLQSFFKSVA